MYWVFLTFFAVAVLIPDIVRDSVGFLPEERAEEVFIFLIGIITFFTFLKNEDRLAQQRREKETAQKKMNQTMKDLVESYSYIGEVNRKMDILMGVALGISDQSILDKKSEKDAYESIINAAIFLLRADFANLRFINQDTKQTEKEIKISEDTNLKISNSELLEMEENVNIKKIDTTLIISSPQTFNNVKSYILINGYDETEENKPKNTEILKLFATQAIFLYAYAQKCALNQSKCDCDNN